MKKTLEQYHKSLQPENTDERVTRAAARRLGIHSKLVCIDRKAKQVDALETLLDELKHQACELGATISNEYEQVIVTYPTGTVYQFVALKDDPEFATIEEEFKASTKSTIERRPIAYAYDCSEFVRRKYNGGPIRSINPVDVDDYIDGHDQTEFFIHHHKTADGWKIVNKEENDNADAIETTVEVKGVAVCISSECIPKKDDQ